MQYRETTPPVEKAYLKALVAILLGSISVILAVSLAQYEMKSLFVVSVVLVGMVFVLYFATEQGFARWALIFLGLGIPFNLDINLFYRVYVGVTSVDIGMTLICAVILYALFFYQHVREGEGPLFRYNKLLVWAPLLYIGAGFLSFYNASSPTLVVLELVRLAMLFLILFIIMNLRKREQLTTFLISLAIGVIMESAIAYYQFKTGRALGLSVVGETLAPIGYGYHTRAGGTIGHPNIMAYYFEMLVPLMLAMLMAEERGWLKAFYLAATIAGLVGMYTTQSRGSWITIPLSLPLVFIVMYSRRLRQARSWAMLVPGLLITALLFLLILPTIRHRLSFEDVAARSRIPLNRAAFSIVKQFPVTGVGLNNLARVFRTYDTTGGSAVFSTEGDVAHIVHNVYLWVWAETGTIGLAAFAGIFISAFYVGFKYLFKVDIWQRGILIGAVCGLLAQAIHGFVDPGFRILMSTSMLFYSLIGIIGAIAVNYGNNNNNKK